MNEKSVSDTFEDYRGNEEDYTRIPGDTSKPGVTHKTRGGGRIKGGIEGGTFFKIKIQIRLKILR